MKSTESAVRRAGVYARISQDADGVQLGVTRQREDCTAEAARRGWPVVETYTDNDVSATRSKVRPQYQRMVADVARGHINALVVWDIDRLTRSPREIEDVIDLAERFGLALANVSGDDDLSTSDGRMMARIKGTLARREIEQMSKRLKRVFLQKAENGEPHGYPPYGFMRIQPTDENGIPLAAAKKDVAHPQHADVVREAARRVLAHESLRSVAIDFNQRKLRSPKGGTWNSTILRQILLRPTNAGLRQYQGRVLGASTSEALYGEAIYDQLVALLKDPARKSNFAGPGFKYLLSGVAICGLCGGPMRRQIGRVQVGKSGASKRQPPSYNCSMCFKVRRHQAAVDEIVVDLLVARLEMPDAFEALTTGDPAAVSAAQSEIVDINAKLAVVADRFMADEITAEQLTRMTAISREKLARATRDLEGAKPRSVTAALIGENARSRWDALPLAVQREVVEELMTVTIMPAGSGTRFDPEKIVITWKELE